MKELFQRFPCVSAVFSGSTLKKQRLSLIERKKCGRVNFSEGKPVASCVVQLYPH